MNGSELLRRGVLFLIDKPAGLTSHDVVERARRTTGMARIGHSGTLDPLATGLLLLCAGGAARLQGFFTGMDKSYEGVIRLGQATATYDRDGEPAGPLRDCGGAGLEQIERAAEDFRGEFLQSPPPYSAKKVGGRRFYEMARKGETVPIVPKKVRVSEFSLGPLEQARLPFRMRCSSGTYVRSLVAEVGRLVGSGAHLARLRRTAIGPYGVEDAAPPDEPGALIAPERATDHLESIGLTEDEARAASHGSILGPAGIEGPYRVVGPNGRLIGIYSHRGAKAVPEVILAPA